MKRKDSQFFSQVAAILTASAAYVTSNTTQVLKKKTILQVALIYTSSETINILLFAQKTSKPPSE
jgi:hypothetical protein